MELNKVILIGNLTRDPESRFLPSGAQVCKLGLAVNRRYKAQGEQREETLFIDIETWNKTAELCSQYLRKGSQVLVEGRLKMDQFQTAQGEKRTKILVVADNIRFGARPEGASGGSGGGYQQSAPGGYSNRQDSWSGSRAREDASAGADSSHDDPSSNYDQTEDDLPF